MTPKRQTPRGGDEAFLIRTLGLRLPADQVLEAHRHPSAQLIYATDGVMSVEVDAGTWIVPPERAVWVPAGCEHAIRMVSRVRLRTLYLEDRLTGNLRGECAVLGVSPLLRELILECLRLRMLRAEEPSHRRLADVLMDQIQQTSVAPLRIHWPRDPRANYVAKAAHARLDSSRSLAEWSEGSGASARTIERLFVRETGLTFGRWLQRARALRALEYLAAGDSVTAAGLAVGYESTSAFIAMFRRVLGSTPGNYFQLISR